MKKHLILFPALCCGLYLLLGSNAAGPASSGNGIRNGAPGSNGTCGTCHGGGAGNTTASIALLEKATGQSANGSYKPGMLYTVTISGNNAALAFFGFQVTAVKGTAQAGAFSNMGTDKHVAQIGGLQLAEHNTSLAKTNGQYEASFDWTAPEAGSGTVTFNGIINGVNKDNGTGGDKASNIVSLQLTEQAPTGIEEDALWKDLQLFPVPASDRLQVHGNTAKDGTYTLTVYDLGGKALWQGRYQAQHGVLAADVPVEALAAGTYFLHIRGEGSAVRMFLKK